MRHAKQAHTRIPVPARPGACQLTVRDLGVTLEGTEILQDVSFQLNCREIVALIGPNGAGKSSLFRSILGQIPYTGTIKFELAGGYPSHPKIGYVPQSPSFDRSCPDQRLRLLRRRHQPLAGVPARPRPPAGQGGRLPFPRPRRGPAPQAHRHALRR